MVNSRWSFPFFVLVLLAFAGILVPHVEPISNGLVQPSVPGDVAWMLTSAGLVMLMTPGLAFFYGGMVSYKNILSTMLQSFLALGVVSIIWVVVGFSLAFGDSLGGEGTGLIGNPLTYFMFNHVGGLTDSAISPTLPSISKLGTAWTIPSMYFLATAWVGLLE